MKRIDVETTYVYPPIPDRRFDWQAVLKDHDPESHAPVGHGATEEEAILDLLNNLED